MPILRACLFYVLLTCSFSALAQSQPNIVRGFMDNFGWGEPGWNGVLREHRMPRVYNLTNDPQERDNVLLPHTWVPKAALPQLETHVGSLQTYPPVPTGAPDPYEPPY
ncbi:MAG: hypothetical protein ACJ0SL_05065 [Candidatus Rariloculaceae bacterium]